MDAETATAQLWRLASPELFSLMTEIEGISAAGYVKWLTDALVGALLES